MNFFTAMTMSHRSQPELSCSAQLWQQLVEKLRERGAHGTRESGAFLLGERANHSAKIADFVLYDDLDPKSLDRGIVHFDGRYYGVLWERCRRTGLSVVADVHTHPGSPRQSLSDRAHPMIAAPGHIALIVPRFAMGAINVKEIGMYRHLGARRWQTVPLDKRLSFLQIDSAGQSHDCL
jgi:proteasome lid subunit RPN8/RPN11